MNDTKSWAQGSRFYEQLWVVDGMNDSAHDLGPLDIMNSLVLLLTWKTMDHELKALDDLNSSRLWLTGTTPGHDLKDINLMNNLGL